MRQLILVMAVIAGVSATAGWLIGHHARTAVSGVDAAHGQVASPPVAPPVPVRVATVARAAFTYTILAYGQLGVAPEALQGVSAPYDGVVSGVSCVVGQAVHRGDVLIELAVAPELQQQLTEARLARTAAEQDLALVIQRRELSLATQGDVALAQHAFAAADQHLALLNERAAGEGGGPRRLRAPSDGVVAALTAKPGTAVLAGADLVDVAPADRREVRLGIEPSAAAHLHPGQAIAMQPQSGAAEASISGTVRWITAALDPATRLVDIVVALPAEAQVLDHERMSAQIPVSLPEVLVIPRSALVSDDNGTKVFVVNAGKAERTLVTVLAEDDTNAAVSGPDITAGTVVVTEGASILDEDHLGVVVMPAASPAGAPAAPQAPVSAPAPAPAGAKP